MYAEFLVAACRSFWHLLQLGSETLASRFLAAGQALKPKPRMGLSLTSALLTACAPANSLVGHLETRRFPLVSLYGTTPKVSFGLDLDLGFCPFILHE